MGVVGFRDLHVDFDVTKLFLFEELFGDGLPLADICFGVRTGGCWGGVI